MTTLSIKNDDATEVAQLLIDQVGTDEVATSKLTIGAAGVNDGFVSSANPLPVTGTITAVTDITNVVSVDDNAGSLTVDNATLSVVGGGTEATAMRVTLASDSTGVLSVDDNGGALTVDNGGTFAVQVDGAALTALQLIDDAIYTDDVPFTAGASKVMAAGFRYDDVTPDTVTQNDVGYARMSSRREQYVTIRDAAGNERGLNVDASGSIGVTDSGGSLTVDNAALAVTGGGVEASALRVTIASDSTGVVSVDDNGGSLTVDGTVAISGTVAVTDNSGSLTVDAPVATPVYVRLSDGAAAITTLPVSLASVPSHAVTNAGTFAVQAASAGDVAHDSADSGNPVKCGAKASTSLAGRTMVADADRTDLVAGIDGAQIVRPHCNLEDVVSGNASNTDGTSTQCIAAQAAGVKTYLTTIIVTNTSASNTYVEIKDGATAKLTIPVPANGGAVCNLPVPMGGTAATAWNFDPGAATTTMYCSMVGFKSKV